ncbi:uncharacterized protein LOC121733705 [Aricia agestis]|uniref:uncharacterized protein LOC121733705 n=1 Tax=Aricia agestis TaxID=91739 RepID=UPI001C20AAE3|nr:uncharacterized protein LOC121733705 [Aricia agestis]
MLIFRCGLVVFIATYIYSISLKYNKETFFLNSGLVFLYSVSGILAGKIIYDRYQQIHILGSLTQNPNVTSFANRIASFSASLLSLGFLVYIILLSFKVNEHCLRAVNIFICGFGSLYLWVQCILTRYICTLFYDKRLSVLRQCLANVSFPVLTVMATFGTVSSILPEDSSNGMYVCRIAITLSSYILTAIFIVFILSFKKDYEYFAEGLRSEMLLDDACSLSASLSDVDSSIFGTQDMLSSALLIKGSIGHGKVS